jgi:hypothetical protein
MSYLSEKLGTIENTINYVVGVVDKVSGLLPEGIYDKFENTPEKGLQTTISVQLLMH